jgi:uncharacterized membrane protein
MPVQVIISFIKRQRSGFYTIVSLDNSEPMKKLFFLSLIIFLFASSCYYDSDEALFPKLNQTCDTTNVTFSGSIKTVLQENCLSCHSNSSAATAGQGYKLEDESDVAAQSTIVMQAILHQNGYAMPKGSAMLDNCSIQKFTIWIREGKKNN